MTAAVERDAEPPAAPEAPRAAAEPFALAPQPRPPSRATLEPVSSDRWSLRVTIDGALKDDLETLRSLLSHKVPDGDLTAVLREAVRCAVEHHGKRRGTVKPERTRKPVAPKPPVPGKRDPIPAAVKRAVWERDGGRCTYVSPEGRRCDSRWRLELDHLEPAARGGPSTVEGLRLRCRAHNILHAEETFGRAYMARFRGTRSAGGAAIAGDSAR